MDFVIEKENKGKRLDLFLSENLNKSRSALQKLIKSGKIKVNNDVTLSHYKLKDNDIVSIELGDKIVKKAPELIKKIEIVAETDDYLVINKPSGLIVHPIDDPSLYTLIDWLLEHYPQVSRVGDDLIRPGIVHRLDKEASGLMVIAKNQTAFDDLKGQFKARTVIKHYQALVYGQLSKDSDVIEFPINRSKSGKMTAKPAKEIGKIAITEFTVIKKFINYTLLEVKIKTGRTHQIRVHLLAYNHPVVGDNLYSTKVSREKNKKLGLNRIFLISSKLAFSDLSGKLQTFEINLPQELKQVLKQIK
ncbi:MAG: RluA family pseudouridine synthase [bacterium]